MNLMFTYPPLPIGGYETKDDKGAVSTCIIDGYHVYKTMKSYSLFDKNLYKEVLKYLDSSDTLMTPFIDTCSTYKKGYSFFINFSYTNSLHGLCVYLYDKQITDNHRKLIRRLFKNGATDFFFTHLINSAKFDNYDLFVALYSSMIFTLSDIKFITEALYATKNKRLQNFIIEKLTLIGMENTIDTLRIL